jgi:hypothetical protein
MAKTLTNYDLNKFGRTFRQAEAKDVKPCAECGERATNLLTRDGFTPMLCDFHDQVYSIVHGPAVEVIGYQLKACDSVPVLRVAIARLKAKKDGSRAVLGACERRLAVLDGQARKDAETRRVLPHGHQEAEKCDHKFVDSTVCLKCGWDPKVGRKGAQREAVGK